MHRIAPDLVIPMTTFSKWVRDYRREGSESFPGKGQVKGPDGARLALRKELAPVRQERDILKKAVAIFSDLRGKGIVS